MKKYGEKKEQRAVRIELTDAVKSAPAPAHVPGRREQVCPPGDVVKSHLGVRHLCAADQRPAQCPFSRSHPFLQGAFDCWQRSVLRRYRQTRIELLLMTHFFTPLIAYVVPQHVRICDGLRKNADSCATRNLNFMGRKAVLIVQHHPTAAASRAVITFRNRIFQLLKFRHTDAQHFRNTAHEVFSRRASVADGGDSFNG